MSCSMALRRSPKPGAFTAATLSPPRSLLTTSVASASPSTSSALLPGGGVALLRAVESLKRVRTTNEDQKHGIEIVKKAITWPARQIAINSGEDGSVVVGKILENDAYAYGFDAQTGEFGNLVSKGIIDPTKVVRIALQDGASIAGLLITTEAMVAEKPKKETPLTAMPPGGGMDY
jgi:chaperonin GroEL